MEIAHTKDEIREIVKQVKKDGKTVGLVPTMGYFHEGHLSLMRKAREENDLVVASLFVNPIQFGPSEDFKTYPRDLKRDAQMAESVGVDVIFNPGIDEMYGEHYMTFIRMERITEGLCGASRPGHFDGVATVVLKLFNIVQPDRAYFGSKDYQQLKVIQKMVKDLDVPVEIVPMPTVREPDGLAMSSRNKYLKPDERQVALVLSKSLKYAQDLLNEGVTSVKELKKRVEKFIKQEPLARIDYVEIVNADTLECMDTIEDRALLALAVKIGATRLIDNTILIK